MTSSGSMSSARQAAIHWGIGVPSGGGGCGQRKRAAVGQRRGLVERGSTRQQFAAHVVLLVPQLAQDGRDDLLVGGPQRGVHRRAVLLDLLVQLGETVVRDHREHVVVDAVIHQDGG